MTPLRNAAITTPESHQFHMRTKWETSARGALGDTRQVPTRLLSKPQALAQSVDSLVACFEALFPCHLSQRSPSVAIVDTAPLRASTSCPTSRLLDAREAISSSFLVIFSMGGHGSIVLWITSFSG